MPAPVPSSSINITPTPGSGTSAGGGNAMNHGHHPYHHNSYNNNNNNNSSYFSSPLGTSASSIPNSPFSASTLAQAAALRRPSLVLSVGSFHSAQLRRPSFFAPFPYSQSPQQHSDYNIVSQDYSSSPRRGDVYQRDLEANYCKNFSCCGLTLGDLHALLQHYEEAHVRFEEEDDNGHPVPAGFTEDDGWSTGSDEPSPPNADLGQRHFNLFHRRTSHINSTNASANVGLGGSNLSSIANASAAATVAALTAQQQQLKHTPSSFLNAHKKSSGVSPSDIYSQDSAFSHDDSLSAFPNSILRTAAAAAISAHQSNDAIGGLGRHSNKKRDLAAFSTSFDASSPLAKKVSNMSSSGLSSSTMSAQTKASQTAASILEGLGKAKSDTGQDSAAGSGVGLGSGSASTFTSTRTAQQQEALLNTVTGYLEQAIQQGILPNAGVVGSPTFLMAAEDLIRNREEIVNMMESIGKPGSSNADKPYRCMVSGCDKAYKNPNGLKYHNQHGHSTQPGTSDDEKQMARPYRCTFLDCGKSYKNLNGLKYHIEHAHPNLAAALHAHIPGFATLDGSNVSQAALAAAAAIAAVQANPMMMAAANAIMASNNNMNNSQNNNHNNSNGTRQVSTSPSDHTHTPDSTPSPPLGPARPLLGSNLTAYRGSDNTIMSTDVTPMTSPILSRATLPGLGLSIQTRTQPVPGLATPSALSPTLPSAIPTSNTNAVSQVSTLTAALAAVSVEQQRLQQQQQQ
ncbi:Transcriptional regulator of ribosomal biogenesis proteins [Podila epigama]|nr:Transcriptional regulator of ribosomal biogenesis proteins [Podila epigama]